MENNSIKFDKDTPAIVAANKVQSLMAVNKDTGEVGNVEFPLLVQEAGKHVADAVKVTGDVLPTLGDANKRYSFTTGSAGRTLTHGATSLVYGANKQCSAFWDGVAKVWTKEGEVDLPQSEIDEKLDFVSDNSFSGKAFGNFWNRWVEGEEQIPVHNSSNGTIGYAWSVVENVMQRVVAISRFSINEFKNDRIKKFLIKNINPALFKIAYQIYDYTTNSRVVDSGWMSMDSITIDLTPNKGLFINIAYVSNIGVTSGNITDLTSAINFIAIDDSNIVTHEGEESKFLNNIYNTLKIKDEVIDLSKVRLIDRAITSAGVVQTLSKGSYLLEVESDDIFEISSPNDHDCNVRFIKSADFENNDYPRSDYAKGWFRIAPGDSEVVIIPPDTKFLMISRLSGANDRTPQKVVKTNRKYVNDTYKNHGTLGKVSYIANRCVRYIMNVYFQAFYTGVGDIPTFNGTTEYAIRIPSSVALTLATMVESNLIDQGVCYAPIGLIKTNIKRLVNGLTRIHDSWKHQWQSSLWANNIAMAMYLTRDMFTDEEQNAVKLMVESEANDFLTRADGDLWTNTTSTTQFRRYWRNRNNVTMTIGDSKSEEVAWFNSVIATAIMLMPENPNISSWKAKLVEFGAYMHSTQSDLTSTKVINGFALNTLQGYNVCSDGAIINHHAVHPDYIVSSASSIYISLSLWSKEKLKIPFIFTHNLRLVASSLYAIDFVVGEKHDGSKLDILEPGGTIYKEGRWDIYYPNGNDWLLTRVADKAPFLAMIDKLGVDTNYNWSNRLELNLNYLMSQQDRFLTGAFYASDEGRYFNTYATNVNEFALFTAVLHWLRNPSYWTDESFTG